MGELIVRHPEFTDKYSAIDGIAKERSEGHYAEDPIRSDILNILSFNQAKFAAWYRNRYEAIKKHLYELTVAGDVPDLRYGGENSQFAIRESGLILKRIIENLKDGLNYLEKIEFIRQERMFLLKISEGSYGNGQVDMRNNEHSLRGDVASIELIHKDASFLRITFKRLAKAKGNFISVDKIELNYTEKKYDKLVYEFPLTSNMIISNLVWQAKNEAPRLSVEFPSIGTKLIFYPAGDNRLDLDLI